jgi:hypothetical protein
MIRRNRSTHRSGCSSSVHLEVFALLLRSIVADRLGLSAACRRRLATSEERMATSIAVLRGAGFEGEDASNQVKTSHKVVVTVRDKHWDPRVQTIPAARSPSRPISFLRFSCRDTEPQGARWQLSVAWLPSNFIVTSHWRQQRGRIVSSYTERRRCRESILIFH